LAALPVRVSRLRSAFASVAAVLATAGVATLADVPSAAAGSLAMAAVWLRPVLPKYW
jgi:hypothetical protein